MLRPAKMSRLEVVVPTSEIGGVVREISRLNVGHFINITATKEKKYKDLTYEIKPSERENLLHQLANRIDNAMKKMGEIPHPEPKAVEGKTAQVLSQIDEYLSELESKIAEIDNLMKEVEEERSSSDHEIRQVYEAYEGAKRLLADYKIDTARVIKLDKKAFPEKEAISQLHTNLLNIQKTLSLVEIAGKLNSSHEKVPNDEKELVKMQQAVKEALELHQQLGETVPSAKDKTDKVGSILNEVRAVVEKKLDGLESLKTVKSEASKLNSELNKLQSSLSKETVDLLGEQFSTSIKNVKAVLSKLEALNLDSSELGEAIKEISTYAYDVRSGFEILENAEKYLNLDVVKNLIEGMRENDPSEIKNLLDTTDQILAKAKLEKFETVRRALKVLYLEHRLNELAKEPEKLKKLLEAKTKDAVAIHIHREVVDIELKIEDLKRRFRQTDKTTVFEVWVDETNVEKTVKAVKKASPSAEVYTAGEETGDRTPTLMKHPKMAEWSLKLVRAYGLPNYHEIDPTMIMFITFPILFGMMFGDLGHGLFIFIGAIFLNKIFERFKLSGELWEPIREARIMIILCGITATVFGCLYGECFGPLDNPNNLFYGTALAETLEHYVWFHPLDTEHGGLLFLFKMSLTVGIMQVTFGIILDIINRLRTGNYKKALHPGSWLWFYLSLSYLILSVLWGDMAIIDIMNKPELLITFFIVPFAGMFALHRITESSMDTVSEVLTKVIESISNTLSYGRIMALAIAHTVFSTIAIMGSGIIFWPIFIMVTLLMIIALEGIITFAHTLRLHWVEWFGKYYQGDGVPYEIFQIQRKFTT